MAFDMAEHLRIEAWRKGIAAEQQAATAKAIETGKPVRYIASDGVETTCDGKNVFYNQADWY